jgi:pyruvate/2-oxoglutarate dehydrogenase complex dihydrolipoamide dehydrogenase (E3) component
MVVPWATFTTPEIAHVGMYEWQAAKRQIPFKVWVVVA